MSAEDRDDNDPLQSLIAEFLAAEIRGETVDRKKLVDQHPDHAGSIREFFASHDRMKSATKVDPPTLPPAVDSLLEDPTIPPGSMDEEPTIAPNKAASSENGLEIGDKVRYFGDYELLEEIARGGMGVVYKARQANLNRIVALKMILAGQFAGEEDVQRFYTEAEAAASLDHPGVVPIFEVGEHAGQHYFSMGYIEGVSLAQRVAEGPLPPREAAELVRKICDAMAYAHDRGVIHRDLKPANILIDSNGQPKVTDFGLAKKTEADSGLTGTGQILGTPAYMPPEQASGKTDVGPLADVYSLGAILYCLLTGRPPFQAASPMDTLLQVLDKEPVAVRVLNPQVPNDLETVCLKCLSKETQKRYPSAQELGNELGRFVDDEPIQARPVSRVERSWRWCKRNPAIAALTAAAASFLIVGTAISLTFGIQAQYESEKARVAQGLAESSAAEAILESRNASRERDRANREKERANLQRDEAQRQLELAQRRFYATQMLSADRDWQAKNIGSAWQHLNACQWNLRNWEFDYLYQKFTRGQTKLSGNAGLISSVAYSPDGTQIATSGDDNDVRIWDVDNRRLLRTIRGHKAKAYCVAFSPNGKLVVSGSGSDISNPNGWGGGDQEQPFNKIKLWDVESGQELQSMSGHEAPVTCVAFSPDGKRIYSGSKDFNLRVWDAESGKSLHSWKGRPARCLSTSPDGQRLVTGGQQGHLLILNAEDGEQLVQLSGHRSTVLGVAFNHDGSQIVSGSQDQSVRIWDARSGELIRNFSGHSGAVYCVDFSPDGTRVVSGSDDKTVREWDVASGQQVAELTGHASAVMGLAYCPDGSHVASGGIDYSLRLWDMAVHRAPQVGMKQWKLAVSIVFSSDGNHVVSSGNVATIWDAWTGEKIRELHGHQGDVLAVAISADDEFVVTGSYDHTLKVWETSTGKLLHTLVGHEDSLTSVAISPDGSQVASCSIDGTVRLWDTFTGHQTHTLSGHIGPVHSVAFSHDGELLVSGAGNINSFPRTGEIKTWDVSSGNPLVTMTGHDNRVASVAFSADGDLIVSGGADQLIKIWDTHTGRERRTLVGHGHTVNAVAFSSDGERIISCSSDDRIKLWDVASGQEVLSLTGSSGRGFTTVALSPDERRIVSGGVDGTIKIWDAGDGEPSRVLEGHGTFISFTAFSADGSKLVTGAADKTLKVWDIGTGRQLSKFTSHVSKILTTAEFSPDGDRIVSGGGNSPRLGPSPGELKVWDSASGIEILSLVGHDSIVRAVRFSPDASLIISTASVESDAPADVRVWDARTGKMLLTLSGHVGTVYCLAFSADGERIITGGADKTMREWDLRTGKLMKTVDGYPGSLLALSPIAGTALARMADERSIEVFNLATQEPHFELVGGHTVRGRPERVGGALSHDGTRVLSFYGFGRGEISLWNSVTGELLETLAEPDYTSSGKPTMSTDRKLVARGTREGAVRVWDVSSRLPTAPHDAEAHRKETLSDRIARYRLSSQDPMTQENTPHEISERQRETTRTTPSRDAQPPTPVIVETWSERLGRNILTREPEKMDVLSLQISSLPRDSLGHGQRLDEGRTYDWLVGSGTAIYGSIEVDQDSVMEYQEKRSYLDRFTDDLGTDLTANPGAKSVSTFFKNNRPLSVDFSQGEAKIGFTLRGYRAPAKKAKKLSASAMLSFRSFADVRTAETAEVKFVVGESFRIGPVLLKVQDPKTVPKQIATFSRGASLSGTSDSSSPPAFALVVTRREKPVVEIELLDAEGNVVVFNEDDAGLKSEGLLSGPLVGGDRIVWLVRKTLAPPTGVRVKWYDRSEMIQVPIEVDTYLGLGKATRQKPLKQTSGLAGTIDGRPFRPNLLEYKNDNLSFRRFDDQIGISLFFWRDSLKGGASLRAGDGMQGGPRFVNVRSAGGNDVVDRGFSVALEISRFSPTRIEGTIDLKIEDRDLYLKGPFSVDINKKPTDALDQSDAPYVLGRARVVGRASDVTIGSGFSGIGAKGYRLHGTSSSIQQHSSASWHDGNDPQISSILRDGDDHVIFRHTKLAPGDYLFWLKVGGRELNSGRLMAWVQRTVKEGDQIELEMDVDLTQLGSVEVTIPDSIAQAFQASFDREMKRQKERRRPGSSDYFGTMTPILSLYLNPRELDSSKLIAGRNPFNWGRFDPGQATITVDQVPPGTYVARCGRSQAEVTVITGQTVTVTLVNQDDADE